VARFFKKINSQVKETVEDDFIDAFDEKKVGQNVSLKVNTTLKTPNGVMIKASGSSHANGNEVDGTLEPEFKFNENFTLKGKLQTNNAFEGSFLINDYLGKGSTVFLTDKLTDKKEKVVEGGFDYLSKDLGSLNLKLITNGEFDLEKTDFYGAAVAYKNGFSIAGDCKLNVSDFKFSSYNGYVEYVKGDLSVAVFGKYEKKGDKEKKTFGVGYHQNIKENIRGAVDFSLEHKSVTSLLRFGTNYKVDDNTSVKTRLCLRGTRDMRVGFVLKQNILPSTKITFTSDINTRLLYDNVSEGYGHQFGVTLSFFD